MAVLTNDRTLYNPYGEADDHLVPGNVKEGIFQYNIMNLLSKKYVAYYGFYGFCQEILV